MEVKSLVIEVPAYAIRQESGINKWNKSVVPKTNSQSKRAWGTLILGADLGKRNLTFTQEGSKSGV